MSHFKGTKEAGANDYTGGDVDTGTHSSVAKERNLERRKAHGEQPAYSTETWQSLLMVNERQNTPIGHSGPQISIS